MFEISEKTIRLIASQYRGAERKKVEKNLCDAYNDIDRSIAKLIRKGADIDSLFVMNIIEDCSRIAKMAEDSGVKL